MSDFGPFQLPENVIFDIGGYFEGFIGRAQVKILRNFVFGNFQKISKVSKNIFWASCDHVVAQKNRFFRKKVRKSRVHTEPPPG